MDSGRPPPAVTYPEYPGYVDSAAGKTGSLWITVNKKPRYVNQPDACICLAFANLCPREL